MWESNTHFVDFLLFFICISPPAPGRSKPYQLTEYKIKVLCYFCTKEINVCIYFHSLFLLRLLETCYFFNVIKISSKSNKQIKNDNQHHTYWWNNFWKTECWFLARLKQCMVFYSSEVFVQRNIALIFISATSNSVSGNNWNEHKIICK